MEKGERALEVDEKYGGIIDTALIIEVSSEISTLFKFSREGVCLTYSSRRSKNVARERLKSPLICGSTLSSREIHAMALGSENPGLLSWPANRKGFSEKQSLPGFQRERRDRFPPVTCQERKALPSAFPGLASEP
jgi:hypothetical protein